MDRRAEVPPDPVAQPLDEHALPVRPRTRRIELLLALDTRENLRPRLRGHRRLLVVLLLTRLALRLDLLLPPLRQLLRALAVRLLVRRPLEVAPRAARETVRLLEVDPVRRTRRLLQLVEHRVERGIELLERRPLDLLRVRDQLLDRLVLLLRVADRLELLVVHEPR